MSSHTRFNLGEAGYLVQRCYLIRTTVVLFKFQIYIHFLHSNPFDEC